MQKYIFGLAIGLLLMAAPSAMGQNRPVDADISEEEYGLFRQALLTQNGGASLNADTLSGLQADADWLNPPLGLRLSPDLIKDFNEKNSKPHKLAAGFLQQQPQSTGFGTEGKKKISLSRAGFDSERRHALLIMAITYYLPEDVMNEGVYIFMEKLEGRWTVRGSAAAWDMRLGSKP